MGIVGGSVGAEAAGPGHARSPDRPAGSRLPVGQLAVHQETGEVGLNTPGLSLSYHERMFFTAGVMRIFQLPYVGPCAPSARGLRTRPKAVRQTEVTLRGAASSCLRQYPGKVVALARLKERQLQAAQDLSILLPSDQLQAHKDMVGTPEKQLAQSRAQAGQARRLRARRNPPGSSGRAAVPMRGRRTVRHRLPHPAH